MLFDRASPFDRRNEHGLPAPERDPVGGARQVGQVGALSLVQLQGARDGIEDRSGCSGDRAALELGVVLDADPGERGDFGASEPADSPVRRYVFAWDAGMPWRYTLRVATLTSKTKSHGGGDDVPRRSPDSRIARLDPATVTRFTTNLLTGRRAGAETDPVIPFGGQ